MLLISGITMVVFSPFRVMDPSGACVQAAPDQVRLLKTAET